MSIMFRIVILAGIFCYPAMATDNMTSFGNNLISIYKHRLTSFNQFVYSLNQVSVLSNSGRDFSLQSNDKQPDFKFIKNPNSFWATFDHLGTLAEHADHVVTNQVKRACDNFNSIIYNVDLAIDALNGAPANQLAILLNIYFPYINDSIKASEINLEAVNSFQNVQDLLEEITGALGDYQEIGPLMKRALGQLKNVQRSSFADSIFPVIKAQRNAISSFDLKLVENAEKKQEFQRELVTLDKMANVIKTVLTEYKQRWIYRINPYLPADVDTELKRQNALTMLSKDTAAREEDITNLEVQLANKLKELTKGNGTM